MTSYSFTQFIVAIAVGLGTGVWAVYGFRSPSYAAGLQALERRMGGLLSLALFCSVALPTAAMWLIAALRDTPTGFDSILLVVLIGLGGLSGYTLIGNALKQMGERG